MLCVQYNTSLPAVQNFKTSLTLYTCGFFVALLETVKPARRERREQAYLRDPDGTKQYRPSGQVIGGYTFKLLNFRFKKVPRNTAKKLSELEKKSLHR